MRNSWRGSPRGVLVLEQLRQETLPLGPLGFAEWGDGREALVAQARRNHTERTQHLITNCVIDLSTDHAEIGANLLVTFAADGAPTRQLGERYAFEAARTVDGW